MLLITEIKALFREEADYRTRNLLRVNCNQNVTKNILTDVKFRKIP